MQRGYLNRHPIFLILAVFVSATLAGAAAPMNYLSAYGSKANIVLPLTWGVLVISLVVVLVILFSVAGGVWRKGRPFVGASISQIPVGGTGPGLNWIYVGVAITAVVLVATVFWTMRVLAQTYLPPSPPRLTIVITGHQWWWEAEYRGNRTSQTFETANEIHIPTGEPVLFQLKSGDVIHSFWVPPLNGKTDTIPGQTNFTWLEASQPGTYRGQCTEYCGLQHAHMALLVIAQTPADFEAWRQHQLQDQPKPANDAQTQALNTFIIRCGSCHTVRGTDAGGIQGPDLSHLMTRTTIAAGTLTNTPGNLSAWVADPQSIKPGSFMPRLELSGSELVQVRGFLESLK